jgi:RimK family alpha-L-glutamate ligase
MKLVILTKDVKSETVERLSAEMTKTGGEVYAVNLEGAYLKDNKIFNIDDKKGFEISPQDTVVAVRGSITLKDSYLDLLSQIEKRKIMTVNNRLCNEICADKFRTSIILDEAGIAQPKTALIAIGDNIKTNYPEQAFNKLDTKFPVILKTLRGAKGVGVLLIESMQALESTTQLLYKLDESSDLLLQEYIKSDFDIRVHVLNGEIIGVMQRNVPDDDFRSNYAQGATTEKYKLSKKEEEVALAAANAVSGYWVGVDFIPNKGNPLVLEVNSSAGTEGIEQTIGSSINRKVIKTITNSDNWIKAKTAIGVREIFEFDLFGKMKAKLDTGNSVKTLVMHADDLVVKNDKVTFTSHGREYTMKLYGIKKIRLNGDNGLEERPMVMLDFTFNGVIHKNVTFTLDDRSTKTTEVLVNKDWMIDNSFIIDPSLMYTLGEL